MLANVSRGVGATVQDADPATACVGFDWTYSNLAYSYAVVLRNEAGADSLQADVVEALIKAGLKIAALNTTSETQDQKVLVILANADSELLEAELEIARQDIDALTQTHNDANVATRKAAKRMTAVEVTILTDRVVRRAFSTINYSDEGVKTHAFKQHTDSAETALEKLVVANFPLHDAVWNAHFLKEIKQLQRKRYRRRTKASSSEDRIAILTEAEAGEIVREHFGAEVQIYFAFQAFYTTAMNKLAVLCISTYILLRVPAFFFNVFWTIYTTTIGVIGWAIPALWAPILMHSWKVKCEHIVSRYSPSRLLVPASHLPNPHISREDCELFVRSPAALERRRRCVLATTVGIVFINMLVLSIAVIIFIQWYVYGKMSPACDCCFALGQALFSVEVPRTNSLWRNMTNFTRAHFLSQPEEQTLNWTSVYSLYGGKDTGFKKLGLDEACKTYTANPPPHMDLSMNPTHCGLWSECFPGISSSVGTSRWVYILCQGILLGLMLDVIQLAIFGSICEFLTKKQAWKTVEIYRRNLTRKVWCFLWYNMYCWFWVIAFLYVPWGSKVQEWIVRTLGVKAIVPTWGWRDSVINLDECFLTPMLFSSLINFLLDTFTPYLVTKSKLKASELRRSDLSLRHAAEQARDRARFAASESAAKARKGALMVKKSSIQMVSSAIETAKNVRIPTNALHSSRAATSKVATLLKLPQRCVQVPEVDVGGECDKGKKEEKLESEAQSPSRDKSGLETGATALAFPATPPITPPQQYESNKAQDTIEDRDNSWLLPLQHGVRTRLGVKLPVFRFTPDENHYDATDIFTQSTLACFATWEDYLSMCMQFGYVCMFTVVWGPLPIAASVRNAMEYVGDAYRLMYGSKRPVPSTAERGIGEWQSVFPICLRTDGRLFFFSN